MATNRNEAVEMRRNEAGFISTRRFQRRNEAGFISTRRFQRRNEAGFISTRRLQRRRVGFNVEMRPASGEMKPDSPK
jgi:hypothetical protein